MLYCVAMLQKLAKLGDVCTSLMGHDKGRNYLIVKIECPDFILLADGQYRPMAFPKRKRIKHVRLLPYSLPALQIEKVLKGTLKDNEIHRFLLSIKKGEPNQ